MVRDVDASLTNALVASEVRVRQHHELVVPGRDGVVGAVMFSLVAVACAAAAIVATATRPAGIALAFLFANLARRSWRAGVTVSGAQIEVRDGQHTSRVDFDDIVDVSTGTQGASIPPEVVLTTQSGHQVFVGGEGWWQRGQAKHYAKSAFEMSEADLRELAVLGRYRARFAREWPGAATLVLASCASCLGGFAVLAATTTGAVAGALLGTLVFAALAGSFGYLAFLVRRKSQSVASTGAAVPGRPAERS